MVLGLQTAPDWHRLVLNLPLMCYRPTETCTASNQYGNACQLTNAPDEALYHVSLLFKCVQREGQPDLLFIPSKPPYPSMVRLKIISEHRLWTTASDRVLWRTRHTLFNNSQLWWHRNMHMTRFTIDCQQMNCMHACVCVCVCQIGQPWTVYFRAFI